MKKLKRILRLMGLVSLILMASVGMGITGAVPVPVSTKKDETIELIDTSSRNSEEDDEEEDLTKYF